MKSLIRSGALVGAVLLLVPILLLAQKQQRTVFVSAVDQTGAPVLNLTPADFEVREGETKKPVTYAALANAPMRIILFVDTSENAAPYQGQMKAALTTFIDAIPDKHEIGIVSIGRQVRVRIAPTTDRAKLKSAANGISIDGGGIIFFDGLREVESRFLKKDGVRWPVYAMFVTDGNEASSNMQNEEFTRLATDMLSRGTTVHAVVVQKLGPTPVTDIVSRLTTNSGGLFDQAPVPAGLPDKIKGLAARIVSDAEKMATRYQVEYTSDPKFTGSMDVGVTREGVKGTVSLKRSF